MRRWLDDLHHALRAIQRAPGFTATAAAILAIGIGVNVAIFSLVDVILFRQLPVEEPSRLVRLFATGNDPGGLSSSSYPSYLDYRDRARSFESLAAYSSGASMNLAAGESAPERVVGAIVTGEYFATLGVQPQIGRMIEPADASVRGDGAVAVLSHQLWARRFGGDPAVLGTTVRINSQPFTIVGVAPRGFWGIDFDEPAQLWIPISMTAAGVPQFPVEMVDDRRFSWLDVVGRLREEGSIDQAAAEVRAIALARAETQEEKDPVGTLRAAAEVARGTSDGAGTMTQISWFLLGMVGVVLLIACADVAGLMLVRAEKRQREIAMRMAMGSSRWRAARAILLESVLLALIAGVAGVALAVWCVRAFLAALPPSWPFPFETTANVIDLRVLGVTAGVALVVGVAFGVLPAMRATRGDLVRTLRNESSRGSSRSRLGAAFVVTQVGLATILLVAAGLLVRTVLNMQAVDPGFDSDGRVVATIDLGSAGYERPQIPAVWERILAEAQTIPGAEAAALARTVPVQRSGMRHSVRVEGYTPPPGIIPNVEFNVITPGFFEALGVPVLLGRSFTDLDREETRPVAIINQAMAEEYFRDADPIGEWLGEIDAEVIGVVGDFQSRSLRDRPFPTVFRPATQAMTMTQLTLLVASERPSAATLRDVQLAMRRVDPDLPLFAMSSLRQKLGYALAEERLVAGLLGAFAVLALILAAGGLYSLLAYRTEMRRKEFGIRMALGADRAAVLRSVLSQGVALAALGILAGAAISIATSRFLSSLVFDVAPNDPATLIGAAAVLLAVAAAACALPARRAASTEPSVVLKSD